MQLLTVTQTHRHVGMNSNVCNHTHTIHPQEYTVMWQEQLWLDLTTGPIGLNKLPVYDRLRPSFQ